MDTNGPGGHSSAALNRIIDHTLLRPNATRPEMESFFREAADYQFVTVAVLPTFVQLAARALRGTSVNVMAAISYPRGMAPLGVKRFEVEDALNNGATELDMVLDLEAIKRSDFDSVQREIRMLRETGAGLTVKVILETTLLNDTEIGSVCRIASAIGVDFVKSSTGFNGHVAGEHAVSVMRANVSGITRVKAAGGIRDVDGVVRMVRAGAIRIGTSHGPAIMEEYAMNGRELSKLLEEQLN